MCVPIIIVIICSPDLYKLLLFVNRELSYVHNGFWVGLYTGGGVLVIVEVLFTSSQPITIGYMI